MTWGNYSFQISGLHPYRLIWRDEMVSDQFGALDFIDMPVPIMAIGVGPLGVTLQCADGSLRWLYSDIGYPPHHESWRVRELVRT